MHEFVTTVVVEFHSERRETHVINNTARTRSEASRMAKDHVYKAFGARLSRIVSCVSKKVCAPPPSGPRGPYVGQRFRMGTMIVRAEFKDSRNRTRVTVENLDSGAIRTVYRREFEEMLGPVVTVEYYALYPNQMCYGSDRPVRSSSYGVENLVQVRVTKHDGVIVNKEIV